MILNYRKFDPGEASSTRSPRCTRRKGLRLLPGTRAVDPLRSPAIWACRFVSIVTRGACRRAGCRVAQLMLGHPNPDRGQVEHLPALHPDLRGAAQTRAAALARAQLVPQDLVRIGDLRQRRPGMTGLAPAAAAQRFRGRLGRRRVRRRRLRRVPRVHPQPALQLGVLRPQRGKPRPATARSSPPAALPGQQARHTTDALPGLHTKIIPQRASRMINDLTSYQRSGCISDLFSRSDVARCRS
jgi:hypothetical protein